MFTSFTTAVHNDHGPDSNRQGTYFHRCCKLMKYLYSSPVLYIAEAIGFEPMDRCSRPPVFKTGAIDHSAKPPNRCLQVCIQPLCHTGLQPMKGFEPPDPLLSFMWANHSIFIFCCINMSKNHQFLKLRNCTRYGPRTHNLHLERVAS